MACSWREDPLEGHGIKICSSQKKVSQSMPQDSVYVRELNEDIKSLFIHFVGNTSFGRTSKFLNDKIRIEKDLSKTEA